MAIFDFQDASFRGDQRWASASSWTGYAPWLVLTLAILSVVEIVLGVVWVTTVQSAAENLTFAQVIQPIIIPGLSFFNTIPSLHLHVLARSNKPLMAIIFSVIMGAVYLTSAILYLPPCANGNSVYLTSSAYQRTECPTGSRRDIWAAQISLQFCSAVGYLLHFAMAAKVRIVLKQRDIDEREGRVMVVIDEEAKARREAEARERWRRVQDL